MQSIYNCCLNNDDLSLAILNDIAELLACALGPVIQLLNPEKIVIHGPVDVMGAVFTELLKNNLHRYCFPAIVDQTAILCSTSDEFLAATGAALAIREKLLFNKKYNSLF